MHRPPYGVRAYFIANNRCHTCGLLVDNNSGYPLWGLLLTNNLVDIGDVLFRGPCSFSTISNNVVNHPNSTPLYFTGQCARTTISGNVLCGAWDAGGATGKRPAFGIFFDCATVDVAIAGNVIGETEKDAIVFSGDHAQADIAISGNTIRNIALDGSSVGSRAAVRFGGAATRVAIAGNSFRTQTSGVQYAVRAGGGGLTHSFGQRGPSGKKCKQTKTCAPLASRFLDTFLAPQRGRIVIAIS